MASKITIKFNAPMQNGDIILLNDDALGNNGQIRLRFGTTSALGSITVSGFVDNDLTNTEAYINSHYNAVNRYVVVVDYINEDIRIIDNIGHSTFSVTDNDTDGRITTEIINDVVFSPVKINTITLNEEATNKCTSFKAVILTDGEATEVTSPVQESVSSNPFQLNNLQRNSASKIYFRVRNDSNSDEVGIYVPFLEEAMFKLDVKVFPGSSSLFISWVGLYEPHFKLTYSLNDVNYYESTSFSGLSEGNYTLYIKDGIGCSIQIPFTIDAFTPNVFERFPLFDISNHNSLIYVKREAIDGANVFKNEFNTMSYEEDTQINQRDFKQPFQNNDGVCTQQLKTNFDNVSVNLVNCQGAKVEIPLVQKTKNIGATDVRDVTVSVIDYLGAKFIGVSYVSGKTYDPITLAENGSYYLGVSKPKFMNKDDYINIEGQGWYRVRDVVFIDNLQYLVLDVLSSNFGGAFLLLPQVFKGTSVYNVQPYEVYEYSFDFGGLNGDYYLNVKALDSKFTEEIEYSTEWFNVKEKQPFTYVLQYYNSINNDTYYSTGIRNKIRIPYSKTLTQISNDTQDVVISDTNAYTVEATYRKISELKTINIPNNFKDKIGIALINDRLFLNGVSKLKNKELEQERIGLTNTYVLTIQFINSDYVYSNISSDGVIIDEGQVLGVDDFVKQALGVKQQ